MIYSDLTTFISAMFQIPLTTASSATPFQDTNANNILPRVIDLAEQMIYTDMDMLVQRRADYSTQFTAGSRALTLPTGCMVCEGVSQISPAGSTLTTGGTRNPLEPVALDFIDMCFPSQSSPTGIGAYWAPIDGLSIAVGQTPDAAYVAEVVGTFRPAVLSSTNTTTYLATNYPQLYMAAVAYYCAGYQRDFGAQSEDPKLASSWLSTYERLVEPSKLEEKRRKGESIETSPTSAAVPPSQSKISE